MSFTVIGYDATGRRIVRDDGPAYARRTGFGAVAAGHFSGTTLALPPPRIRIPRAPQKRVRPICGTPLRLDGGPCAGIPNHRGHHRSALAQANRAVGRRG